MKVHEKIPQPSSGVESDRLKELLVCRTRRTLFFALIVGQLIFSVLKISPSLLLSRVTPSLKKDSSEIPDDISAYEFASVETGRILQAMAGEFNDTLLTKIENILGYPLSPPPTHSFDPVLQKAVLELYKMYPSLIEINEQGPGYGRSDESAKVEFLTASIDVYPQLLQRVCGLSQQEFYEELQRVLLLTRLSELPHIKQMQDGHLFLQYVEDVIYLRTPKLLGGYGGKGLVDLYKIQNTAERVAHHIYEPQMQKLFFEFYERYADMCDSETVMFMADMANGRFYLSPIGSNGKSVQSSYYYDSKRALDLYQAAAVLGSPYAQAKLKKLSLNSGIITVSALGKNSQLLDFLTSIGMSRFNTSPSQSALSQPPAQ